MKVEIENLKATIEGVPLNMYQRSLAIEEWNNLIRHVNSLEETVERYQSS